MAGPRQAVHQARPAYSGRPALPARRAVASGMATARTRTFVLTIATCPAVAGRDPPGRPGNRPLADMSRGPATVNISTVGSCHRAATGAVSMTVGSTAAWMTAVTVPANSDSTSGRMASGWPGMAGAVVTTAGSGHPAVTGLLLPKASGRPHPAGRRPPAAGQRRPATAGPGRTQATTCPRIARARAFGTGTSGPATAAPCRRLTGRGCSCRNRRRSRHGQS